MVVRYIIIKILKSVKKYPKTTFKLIAVPKSLPKTHLHGKTLKSQPTPSTFTTSSTALLLLFCCLT